MKTKDLNRSIDVALAKTGIIALVDEATGHQEVREEDELVKMFVGLINEAFVPWCLAIPVRFWKDLFRLLGVSVRREQPDELKGDIERVVDFVRRFVFDSLSAKTRHRVWMRKPRPKNESLCAALKAAGLDEIVDSGNRAFDYRVIAVGAFLTVARSMEEFEEMIKGV
jgi:hypothetical protein